MQALRHSKVKLTWDEDDPERNRVTRRRLSRKEIEGADFTAYLASSESGSEPECIPEDPKSKGTTKKTSRDKLRALLLKGNDDNLPEGWGREDDNLGDVDMEVTFTPALSEKQGEDETTLDVYQRKMREKRKRRKQEVKGNAVTAVTDKIEDDFFDTEGEKSKSTTELKKSQTRNPDTQALSMSPKTAVRPLATPEELALLVVSDNSNAESKHFNLKSIVKAEKKPHRKGKKRKPSDEGDDEIQADFKIDVKDERFKALHEDHRYAIDPSNPQ